VTQTQRSIFTHRMRAGNSDCLKDLVFVDVTLLETKHLPRIFDFSNLAQLERVALRDRRFSGAIAM
jgi:hypothetical protein